MGCLTIGELYQQQLEGLVELGGATVTYYPVTLTGYSVTSQERNPVEGPAITLSGIFGEERVTESSGAITYATTFAIAVGALPGEPSPGDRIVFGGRSYRVVELRRAIFAGMFTNYVLTLGN